MVTLCYYFFCQMLSPLLHQVMILKHLCPKYFDVLKKLWKHACFSLLMMSFMIWGIFPSVMCVVFVHLFSWIVWDVSELWNHSIDKLPHSPGQGLVYCGSLGFCGSEWEHVLSLSFFLCPDPVTPFFSWFIWFIFCSYHSYSSQNCFCLYCFLYIFLFWISQFFRSSVGFPFLVCSCK